MVHSLAVVTTLLVLPTLQGGEDEPRILSDSDVRSLSKKAADWNEAFLDYEYEADSTRQRQRALRSLTRAKEKFLSEWESKQKKGPILSSVVDCQLVFAGFFPYDRESTSGTIKLVKEEGEFEPAHAQVVPRSYDPRDAYRTIVSIPGWDPKREGWTPVQEWHDLVWKDSELGDETIFVFAQIDDGLDMDPMPDPSNPASEGHEESRRRLILGSLGTVQRTYNLDRNRVFLDCGRGSSGFGLRLASYFPDRFAGLVLRDPVDVTDEMRIGSLSGLSILLIATDENKAVCETLRSKLDKVESGSVTVMEAEGEYPFAEMQPKIEEWIQGVRRNLYPKQVVIEPNSDSFNDAYWVQVGIAEPLANLPDDRKPRMVVEADRENNRITVDARAIADFALMLNDEIVDLSQPFTVVVNGTAMKEERERSLNTMVDWMRLRFDPTCVFVAEFATTVPDDEN